MNDPTLKTPKQKADYAAICVLVDTARGAPTPSDAWLDAASHFESMLTRFTRRSVKSGLLTAADVDVLRAQWLRHPSVAATNDNYLKRTANGRVQWFFNKLNWLIKDLLRKRKLLRPSGTDDDVPNRYFLFQSGDGDEWRSFEAKTANDASVIETRAFARRKAEPSALPGSAEENPPAAWPDEPEASNRPLLDERWSEWLPPKATGCRPDEDSFPDDVEGLIDATRSDAGARLSSFDAMSRERTLPSNWRATCPAEPEHAHRSFEAFAALAQFVPFDLSCVEVEQAPNDGWSPSNEAIHRERYAVCHQVPAGMAALEWSATCELCARTRKPRAEYVRRVAASVRCAVTPDPSRGTPHGSSPAWQALFCAAVEPGDDDATQRRKKNAVQKRKSEWLKDLLIYLHGTTVYDGYSERKNYSFQPASFDVLSTPDTVHADELRAAWFRAVLSYVGDYVR